MRPYEDNPMRSSSARLRRHLLACILAGSVALAGCAATLPRHMSPSVLALPAQGESFVAFQQHDWVCRQYASDRADALPPDQIAADRAAAGAALGAGVGAAAGALIGSGSGNAGGGAAIGAGTGLLAGLLAGSARGRMRAAAVQRSYDMAYTQCMVANGERMEEPAPARAFYALPAVGPVIVPPTGYALILPPPAPSP